MFISMSVKQQSVSMPMSSAGIIGVSSDMKISGYEIDPKALVTFALVLVVVVKVAAILFEY
jgi:preprotein translocase subunit Sec61beta